MPCCSAASLETPQGESSLHGRRRGHDHPPRAGVGALVAAEGGLDKLYVAADGRRVLALAGGEVVDHASKEEVKRAARLSARLYTSRRRAAISCQLKWAATGGRYWSAQAD